MRSALSVIALLIVGACSGSGGDMYPHENEKIGSVRDVYDAKLMPDVQVNTFRNIHRLFPTRTVPRGLDPFSLLYADDVIEDITIKKGDDSFDLFDYLSFNRVAGLLVIKNDAIVHESYHLGNTEETRWMSMSIAKSITATLAGAAIQDGSINGLDDLVTQYLGELKGTAYDGVTVRQLLQMASGAGWDETYADPASDRRRLLEAQIAQRPGEMMNVMKGLKRVAEPGAVWNYSTGETQVVGALVSAATGKTLSSYLSEKIWANFGMEDDAAWWLESMNGMEVGGSGLSARLRDYGRYGLFLLHDGIVDGQAVLPPGWVEEASRPQTIGGEKIPYGFMFWPVSVDGVGPHGDAYEAQGIFGQRIYINPSENLVIVVLSAWPKTWLTPPIDDLFFYEAVIELLGDDADNATLK